MLRPPVSPGPDPGHGRNSPVSDAASSALPAVLSGETVLVVGAGRMGTALVEALRSAGLDAKGPATRGADGADATIVLLAVPDAQIGEAAALIAPGRLVGHLSGATTLEPLAAHEAFSIHPLVSVTRAGAVFAGAPAALAASTPHAREVAEALSAVLGMTGFGVADDDRAAYHAAASIASNFLLTLEDIAAQLAASAGVPRDALVPLVRATVENWAARGAAASLTGPIARGDDDVVVRQRAAVAARLPQYVDLFDALVTATRAVAASRPSNPTLESTP